MIDANYYTFAIVLKENNKVIGNISLSCPDKLRYPAATILENDRELGFTLSKKYNICMKLLKK